MKSMYFTDKKSTVLVTEIIDINKNMRQKIWHESVKIMKSYADGIHL